MEQRRYFCYSRRPFICLRASWKTLFAVSSSTCFHEIDLMKFCKMHGLGNDFIVVSGIHEKENWPSLSRKLSNRNTGIGFDQLLVVEKSQQADFFCRIFNSDGSEAEQCGNGLRCVARYLHEQGWHPHPEMRIGTKAGCFDVTIHDYDSIEVIMGVPRIIHVLTEIKLSDSHSVPVSILSLGNPHTIVKVSSIENVSNKLYPQDTNVGFMKIVDRHHIYLRTFERGSGETCACGSNAVAAAAAGIANDWLASPVKVEFRYGSLNIRWAGIGNPVSMTGPASQVFSGIY